MNLTIRSSIKIHLLDLLDGSPHKIPVKKNLSINFTPHYSPYVSALKISRSRIALVVASPGYREAGHATQLIVWDWREGEVVCSIFFHVRPVLTQPPPRYSISLATI